MSATNSPARSTSTRKRTAVPLYNLKVLTGTSRHTRAGYLEKDKQQTSNARIMAALQPDPSTLIISGLPKGNIRRGITSSLTSPTESPRMNALESSLRDIPATNLSSCEIETHTAARRIDRNSGNMASQDAYECFNTHSSPRGHYYSAPILYARGVWVGYL
jgi:hypothetical protein